MKHIYKGILAAAMLFSVTGMKAQGWPADYDGVMLQGFYWDSYSDTKWTNLESQAEELSKFFDLIWIPNSAQSDGGMGYMPVYWFSHYDSAFGTEAQLRSMIKAFKEKGTGFIADVVVNHRNGENSAWNFPAETYNGKIYDMADGSIVSNDNIWTTGQSDGWGKDCPSSYKGKADTGDLFDGCRDLDHTNPTVQEHIKAYTTFLLKELGYEGFRYDMVKGYSGEYTKIYNEASKPKFSVGEFWDSYDPIAKWIETTGKTSAAFDFPCKTQLNAAFNNGLKLEELTWTNPDKQYQPAGLIHFNYRQYAVTFVDNHDTYRENYKFADENHILAANAFILSSPGTPCVFLKHLLDYPTEIKWMVNARKMAGVTNTSEVKVLSHTNSCYMAEVKGKRGTLVVKIGSEMVSPDGYADTDIVTSGNDYCIWVKSDGSYQAPEPGKEPEIENGLKIYYDNSNTNFNPVYCYSFGTGGDNGKSWPGYSMKSVGGNVYSVTVPQGSNVVFNGGSGGPQTVDVMSVKDGFIYCGQASTDSEGKYKVATGEKFDGVLPKPTTALYLNGNFDNFTGDWDPTQAKEMDKEPGHYTLRNIKMNGSSGEAYFSFADTKGDWDTVNNKGIRYGASSKDEPVTVIKDGSATSPSYNMTAGNYDAWKIANGTYDIIVEPGTWKLTVYDAGKAPSFESSIFDQDNDNPGEDNKDDPNNSGGNQSGDKDDNNQNGGSSDNGDNSGNQGGSGDNGNQGDDQNGNDSGDQGDSGNQDSGNQGDQGDNGNQDSGNQGGSGNNGDDAGNQGNQGDNGDNSGNQGNQGDNGNDSGNNGGSGDNGDDSGNNDGSGDQNDNPVTPDEDDDDLGGNGGNDTQDPDAGVNGIEQDDVEPVYYNLTGVKVQNPSKGIYIKVTGNKREKVVIP